MQLQLQTAETQQSDSKEQSAALKEILNSSQLQQQEIGNMAADFSTASEEAEAFIQRAQISKSENEDNARKLNKIVEINQNKSRELEGLVESFSELREELIFERNQQSELNEKSKNHIAQTEKLNQQQATLIELGNSRIEELEQELQETLVLNKKTQEKLNATESKFSEAVESHEKLRASYGKAVRLLKQNEASLADAKSVVAESKQQNVGFNSALENFQHSTDQSQQLVLRSQTSLQKLFSRNELLERENRLLSDRVNAMSVKKPLNVGTSIGEIDDVQLGDISREPVINDDNKNSFYRLMTLLAIILPLSFIAHSVITNVGAQEMQPPVAEVSELATPLSFERNLLESQTFTPTSALSADSLSSKLR
ncbi:MAG: hypothetical protein GKR91_01570 [Pseudomonadales bacterium]|nr:hypothetical protein [Pseudomonadales bacterium]